MCVPIDPSNCDAFDPFSSDAPKVHELLQEYKKFGADENAVKKTAMGKALETFERCFWSKLKVANEEEKKKKMMMNNNNVLNESNALNKNSTPPTWSFKSSYNRQIVIATKNCCCLIYKSALAF